MLDHNSKGFASMFSLYCLEQPSSIDQSDSFVVLVKLLLLMMLELKIL